MRTVVIILGIIVLISTLAMAFVKKSVDETETHEYEVIETFDGFEIRKYAPALYSSVQYSTSSYKQISGQGFRTLAGYIFGGNENQEQIAMTSPVTMELKDTSKMMFMVPKGVAKSHLPKPNDASIYFEEYPERTVAAIRFGGWASDEKINAHIEELAQLLAKENIRHSGEFAYLGYNPPFDVVNRRNEIIVEVEWRD
jgi:hypothetical protein